MRVSTPDGPVWPVGILVPRAERALRMAGVSPGDRVLLAARNGPELVPVLIVLVKWGCSVVLCEEQDQRLVEVSIEQSTPHVVVRTGAQCAEVIPAGNTAPAQDIDTGLPPLQECNQWYEREDALVMFTSGSSGAARGVVRSGRALQHNIEATQDSMRYQRDDIFLALVPLTHQYGFSLVLLAWMMDAHIVVGNPLRPVLGLQQATKQGTGITVIDAAPSHYKDLLSAKAEDPGLGRDIRYWCVGGAPLPESLRSRFRETVGSPLLDGYGMTEMGNICLANERHASGVGRPINGVQLRVQPAGARDGNAGPGTWGKIMVLSPGAFHRYLQDSRGSTGGDQWFETGDTGYWDEDGCLHVMGRNGAVHRNGHTIHLAGLERSLEAAGISAVMVETDCERSGAHLTAFVVDHCVERRPESEIKRTVRRVLPQPVWPNRVVVLTTFPLLGTGKVDRAALRHSALAGVRRRVPSAAG